MLKSLLHSGMLIISGFIILTLTNAATRPVLAADPTPVRQVNVPYFGDSMYLDQGAIFWFGRVDSTSNYADVRVGYNNTELVVQLHIFDRRLWYDTTPIATDLENWDAATLSLNLAGNSGSAPTTAAHQFVSQLNWWEGRTNFQTAYQGNGTGWSAASTGFTTAAGFRGENNNNIDDRGWTTQFAIPFASLGLSGPPATGTVWGMALVLHDRDDSVGTPITKQYWPENSNLSSPATWGRLRFGLPTYTPPAANAGQLVTIRQGLNGATVTDAHVGGQTICGAAYAQDFFAGWGSANYAGDDQINIQNQWDVADWPCFSKYFVTFPLTNVPSGKAIISATLVMHQFGNAWGDDPPTPNSLIQVLTVADAWNENSITWNNAPLAAENVARSWVYPVPVSGDIPWPGWKRQWDVSQAVADAYNSGQSLRLALYSADGDYHSGKYFSASEAGSDDWIVTMRPTLEVTWGDPYLAVSPQTQAVDFGASATYNLQVQPIGGSSAAVTLTASAPPPNVSYQIIPATLTPPGQATLIVTDSHPKSADSLLANIEITATSSGGGGAQSKTVQLIVGPTRVYLPVIVLNN